MPTATALPVLALSEFNKYIYGLNSGELKAESPKIVVPLFTRFNLAEGLTAPQPTTPDPYIYFVKENGIWWLDTPIEIQNDLPEQSGWYHPITPTPSGNDLSRIGLKVFFTNDIAVYCEIHEDHKLGMYRIQGRTRANQDGKYYYAKIEVPINRFAESELSNNNMWKHIGHDFERRIWKK